MSGFRASLAEKDEVAKTAKEAKAAAKAEKAAARDAALADAARKPQEPKKRAKFMEAMGLVEERRRGAGGLTGAAARRAARG